MRTAARPAMQIHALRRRLLELASDRHRSTTDQLTTDWPLARRDYEREMAKTVAVDAVTRSEVYGDVRCDVIEACGPRATRVVLFLHGGGYTMGSPVTHRGLATRVGEASEALVVVPDYRLAPEHPFPAGLDDARKVWDHLRRVEGLPASSIALVGDSAGGGMAAALTLMLVRDGHEPPACLVLMSPWADLTLSSPMIQVSSEVDPLVDVSFLEAARDAYVTDRELDDPLVSPAQGVWKSGPPTLIHVSRSERLLDDARALYQRMVSVGVSVRPEEWDQLVHVWHQFAPALPQASDAIDRIGVHVRRHVTEHGTIS